MDSLRSSFSISCFLSLFFHILLFYSFYPFFSILLNFLLSLFSLSLSFPSHLFSLTLFFLLFLSSSLFLYLYILFPLLFFLFIYLFFFSSSSLFYFLNASSVPLIGHNYKVWKTLTQVRAFILHLRKPKLIEMEFPKITCYVLVVNRVRFRM